jgi:hypothetical protein
MRIRTWAYSTRLVVGQPCHAGSVSSDHVAAGTSLPAAQDLAGEERAAIDRCPLPTSRNHRRPRRPGSWPRVPTGRRLGWSVGTSWSEPGLWAAATTSSGYLANSPRVILFREPFNNLGRLTSHDQETMIQLHPRLLVTTPRYANGRAIRLKPGCLQVRILLWVLDAQPLGSVGNWQTTLIQNQGCCGFESHLSH